MRENNIFFGCGVLCMQAPEVVISKPAPASVPAVSLPSPPVVAAAKASPPPAAAPVVDTNTKKSLFAEEVKGFGVTPVARPAPAAASPSVPAPQVESTVEASVPVVTEVDGVASDVAAATNNNAALLGWD